MDDRVLQAVRMVSLVLELIFILLTNFFLFSNIQPIFKPIFEDFVVNSQITVANIVRVTQFMTGTNKWNYKRGRITSHDSHVKFNSVHKESLCCSEHTEPVSLLHNASKCTGDCDDAASRFYEPLSHRRCWANKTTVHSFMVQGQI